MATTCPLPDPDARAAATSLIRNGACAQDRCAACLLLYAAEHAAGDKCKAENHLRDYYALFDSLVTGERELFAQMAVKAYRRDARLNYTAGLFVCMLASVAFCKRLLRGYQREMDELTIDYKAMQERCLHLAPVPVAGEVGLLKALECKMRLFLALVNEAYRPGNKRLFVDEFKKYVQAITASEYPFADLQYLVNKTDFGLVDHLRAQHPGLTSYEIDVLCMLRLGASKDGIRLIYSHNNPQSVYTRRTKLHSKLGLRQGLRLEEYLEETVCTLKKCAMQRRVAP